MDIEQFKKNNVTSHKVYINKLDPSNRLKLLKKHPEYIKRIKHPSEKEMLMSIGQKSEYIKYINNPTPEAQLKALREIRTVESVYHLIKHPTIEATLYALSRNGCILSNIPNPTEEMKLAAVTQNGNMLRAIDNPIEEMKLAAVTSYPSVIKYIVDPSIEIQNIAVSKEPETITYIKHPSEDIILSAINSNALCRYNSFFFLDCIHVPIDSLSDKVKLALINNNPEVIHEFSNPSDVLKLEALKRDGSLLEYIPNPTEEMKLAAVKQFGFAIRHIVNPSLEVQLAAVQEDGRVIQLINDPSPQIQLESLQKHWPESFHNIKNPCMAAKKLAISLGNSTIEEINLSPDDKELIDYALSLFIEVDNEKEITYLFKNKYIVYEELDDDIKLAIELL